MSPASAAAAIASTTSGKSGVVSRPSSSISTAPSGPTRASTRSPVQPGSKIASLRARLPRPNICGRHSPGSSGGGGAGSRCISGMSAILRAARRCSAWPARGRSLGASAWPVAQDCCAVPRNTHAVSAMWNGEARRGPLARVWAATAIQQLAATLIQAGTALRMRLREPCQAGSLDWAPPRSHIALTRGVERGIIKGRPGERAVLRCRAT